MILLTFQVDPLVSLMMVEKVPDSTYEMVGGLDKQIKEIKEVCCKEHWAMLRPFSVSLQVSHTPIFGSPLVAWVSFFYIHVGITILIFCVRMTWNGQQYLYNSI